MGLPQPHHRLLSPAMPEPALHSSSAPDATIAPAVPVSVDAFLQDVERRALRMAWLATSDLDVAMDLLQDAMMAFYRHYAKRPPGQWAPLFYRTLNNRIIDHYRRQARWRRWLQPSGQVADAAQAEADPVPAAASNTLAPDMQAHLDDFGQKLQQALQALPHRQRQVFLLRVHEGLDVAATASSLGIGAGSVKTHLHRATQALRAKLEDYQ